MVTPTSQLSRRHAVTANQSRLGGEKWFIPATSGLTAAVLGFAEPAHDEANTTNGFVDLPF
jgi:hypothetical protein